MNPENFKEKINYLLDYKDLLSFYLSEESNESVMNRNLLDQIECDIDFYLHLSMEKNPDLALLN